MQRVILWGWLVLSIVSGITAIVVLVTEGLWNGKAWPFFLSAGASLALCFFQRRKTGNMAYFCFAWRIPVENSMIILVTPISFGFFARGCR